MIRPKITNPSGKRGTTRGHKGATRVLGEPYEIIHVTMEICPKCGHTLYVPYVQRKGRYWTYRHYRKQR